MSDRGSYDGYNYNSVTRTLNILPMNLRDTVCLAGRLFHRNL